MDRPTFNLDAVDIETATSAAKQIVDDALLAVSLPPLKVILATIVTQAERNRLDRKVPDLVGISEIADLMGVSRQRVHQLYKNGRLPDELSHVRSGPVFSLDEIERALRHR